MRGLTFLLFVALMATQMPAQAQVVQEYAYAPDRIYTVRTGLGITTQIELSPSESVLDYAVGFSGGWDINRRDNVFYLKPKNVDVDTNLMVRTEMHTYIFELKVVATDWRALDQAKQAGVQYKVTFKYPEDTKFSSAKEARPPAPSEADGSLVSGRTYFSEYEYATRSKAGWLVPTAVYDDGRFTYIRLSDAKGVPTGNFPAVYGREAKRGEDFLLNTTVQSNTIIVHGVYPYLVIRQGANTIGLRRGVQK